MESGCFRQKLRDAPDPVADPEKSFQIPQYGGGVCQSATTLYNAVLCAGLEVLQVNPHSLKVGYVAGSFDAMVSSGFSDFVFRNNFDSPIYIYSYCNGLECGVKIFGEANEYDIKQRSEVVEFDKETNPTIAHKSKGFLEYYKNGEKVFEKEIRNDKYLLPKKIEE